MILVSTGTNGDPFDRLLDAVGSLRTDEEIVVQHGPSHVRPYGARCIAYVAFDEYTQLVHEARVVVTHAGTGSVLVTLMGGKRPIVVPRLARYREAVDDHQLFFARRLASVGLVQIVEDVALLGELLAAPAASSELGGALLARSPLIDDLGAYLGDVVGRDTDRVPERIASGLSGT